MKKEEKKEVTAQSITDSLKKAEEQNAKQELANDKRLYTRYKKQIDNAYTKMESCYLDTAIAIHSIYSKKLYKLDNFKNIYDFSKQNYDIARGTTNGFINICERFGRVGENGTIVELLPEYQSYSISKLRVMLRFPKDLLLQCSPDMSVRELQKKGKEYEQGLLVEDIPEDEIDVPDDIVDSPNESVPINKPEKADIEESDGKVFVCQAHTIEELLSLQELIADTLKDIKDGNGKSNAVINVSIQF